MTQADKVARIYALAAKLNVKIAPEEPKPKRKEPEVNMIKISVQTEQRRKRIFGNLKGGF